MVAEAGWDPTGRFFTVEDRCLFPSRQHSGFQPGSGCLCRDLALPQLLPHRAAAPRVGAGCPAQALSLAQKMLWIGKPSPEQDKAAARALREALTSRRRELPGAGAKSVPSIAKTNPDNGLFSPRTDPNACKGQLFFSLAHRQMGFATRRCEG